MLRLYFSIVYIFVFINSGFSQSLTISTSGQTGTSGSNWSITGNTLSVTGTANIQASVISNHLTSTGSLSIQGTSSLAVTVNEAINVASGGNNLVFGTDGNTGSIIVNQALTLNGSFSVYGGELIINETINTSTGGADGDVLFKATGDIVLEVSKSITTNGGDVILWANSDGATTNGGVFFDQASSITTSGGHIWIGGGIGSTSWNGLTVGDGYAVSGRNLENDFAVRGLAKINWDAGVLLDETSLNSGGGNIYIAGQRNARNNHDSGAGIINYSGNAGTTIDAGTGTIEIAASGNYSGHLTFGFMTGLHPTQVNGGLTITSANTSATNALQITASSLRTDNAGIIAEGNTQFLSTAATNGGGISIGASSAAGTGWGIWVQTGSLNVLSASGAISLNTGTSGLGLHPSTATGFVYLGSKAGTAVTSSTANMTLTADRIVTNTGSSLNAASSGTLTVESAAASFSQTVSTNSQWVLGAGLTGLTIGKEGNTAAIAIGSAQTIAGSISIYGGDIDINENINTTAGGAAGDILIKSSANIVLAGSKSLTTNGGDVILWANSDGQTADGCAFFKSGSAVSTSGGHIWIGGGSGNVTWNGLTVGDGWAVSGRSISDMGYAQPGDWQSGVAFNQTTLQSSGGHIYIAGQRNVNRTDQIGAGVINYSGTGTLIDADSGTVVIKGDNTAAGNGVFGLMTGLHPNQYSGTFTVKSSNAAAAQAIMLTGTTSAGIGDGFLVESRTRLLSTASTNGGGIAISCTATGDRNALSVGIGLNSGTLEVLSASGDIDINVGTYPLLIANLGVFRLGSISGDADVSSSTANVTFTSNKPAWTGNVPIRSTGTLMVTPTANGSFSSTFNTSSLNYTGITGLTIGNASNTAGVTIGSSTAIAGSISVYGGTITLDANLTTTNNGDISLYTDNAIGGLSTARNVTAAGVFRYIPFTNSFANDVTFPITNLNLNSAGLWIGKSTNTKNITIGSSTSIAGPITLYGGDLALNGTLTSTNDNINLYASGVVTQLAGIIANGLGLHGTGTFTLNHTSNKINTLAGGTAEIRIGSLRYYDSDSLIIGSVNPTGIFSSGDILIETGSGNIYLNESISSISSRDSLSGYFGAIVLNAGKDSIIGVIGGGDIVVSGNGSVSAPNGIVKLYSGSDGQSTGLTNMVGGEDNVRKGVDETTINFNPSLSSKGVYALFREECFVSGLSSEPELCINTQLQVIKHSTKGVTGIGTAMGLPLGITASWSMDTIYINGTPTESGIFTYSIPTQGLACNIPAQGTITVKSAPISSISITEFSGLEKNDSTICVGDSIVLVASGGLSYNWGTSTSPILADAPTSSKTYKVTVTSSDGCSKEDSIAIEVLTIPNVMVVSTNSPDCPNGISGSIEVTNNANWKYLWSIDSTGSSISYLSQGYYSLTVTDEAGCVDTLTQRLTDPFSMDIISTVTDVECKGSSTGAVNLSVSGGSNPYQYEWSSNAGGATGSNITSLAAGNYSVTVTENGENKCKIVGTIKVAEPTFEIISSIIVKENSGLSADDGIICVGDVVELEAKAEVFGGRTIASYLWNTNTSINPITVGSSGKYTVTIIDDLGCTNTKNVDIIVNPNNTVSAALVSPKLILGAFYSRVFHNTSGATGLGVTSGLPSGLVANLDNNRITISGIPRQAGIFNYTIPLTGGCGPAISAMGTMEVVSSPSDNYSCINNVNIPLNDDCMAEISSEFFSIPNQSGFYIYASMNEIPSSISAIEALIIDTVYGEGNWMYGIYNPFPDEKGLHQLICWGTFTTEDKIDPFFVGDTTGLPDDLTTVWDESRFQQYGTYKEIYYAAWEDSLNPIGTQFRPGLWSCYQDVSHPLDSSTWPNDLARRYDTLSFTLSSNDQILTIFAASKLNTNTLDSTAGFDPTIALYRGDFDPASPCENMVGYSASTFIPNPLAGLGFSNNLQNSSIDGTQQDGGDIFAPWLQYPHPLARIEFKAKAGQKYTLVITHKDGPALNHARYNVYFLLNDYKSNSGRIVTNLPGRVYPDSLGVDTAFAYYDFLCYDLDAVMLKNQKTYPSDATVNADRYYTGGNIWQMSKYLGAAEPGLAGGYTVSNRNAMNQQWRLIGEALLSVPGRDRDGSFLDLNQANVYPGPYSVVSGGMTFSLTRSRSQEGDVQDSRSLLDTLLRDYAFAPMVLENCGQWEVKAIDQYTAFGDCGIDVGNSNVAGIITRSWVVSDRRNKTDLDTAFTQLIFRNPNLYDVRLPHFTVSLDCEEVSGEGLPSPSITGYPFVSTLTGFVDLKPDNAVCNLAAGYEDKAIVTNCANNKEFRREWTVYDWCRPGTTIIYNQLIRVGDFTAPVINETSTTLSTNFNAEGCSGSVTITRGSAQDICGSLSIGVKLIDLSGAAIAFSPQNLSAQGQNTNTGTYGTVTKIPGITASVNAQGVMEVKGLGEGKYYVEWEAKDACGNASTERDSFIISDNISPSCVIDDVRTITLTDFQMGGNAGNANPRGEAYLTADRLDEGSWDNCHEVSVQIRRMTTDWADQVKFTCADEGDSVLVEMVVRAGADSTICWTYIKVEDKTIPECREIGTVTMLCSDLPAGDLGENSSVWNQFFADSITVTKTSVRQLCNIEFDANIETEVKIDQCGYGWVNRYYRVYRSIDDKEFADTCRMSIVFSEDHDYWVTFPADEANKECGSLEEVKVNYHEGGCDLITISKNDQKFDATADECYKIIRTYRVINWCEYDGAEVAYQVARRDWNRDGVVGDATTVNVKYRQGVQHEYKDYKGRYVTVVGATGSLNPTGAAQTDADLRDTVYRVGAQTAEGQRAYWESASQVSNSNVTTTLINNGTVVNMRKYFGIHPTPVVPIHTDDYIPQGFFEYTQHLKVFDRNPPELEVLAEDLNFASYSNNKDNGCAAPVSILVKVSDDCTSNLSELVVRDVLLDRDNNNSTGSITFLNKKYDASTSQGTTLYKAEYAGGTLTISSTGLPIGEHKFTVVASDGCGNVQTKEIVFEVEDKKGPAPICIEGFAVELMPTTGGSAGVAMVSATDFVVNKPITDCHDDSGVYLITRMRNADGSTKTSAQVVATAGTETSITLTCSDRALNQPIQVAVIATDGVGNKDYCVTTINVQDNVTPCAASATVAGLIATEENSVVSGVEVSLNASSTKVTAMDGSYFFEGLTLGGDYSIAPKKDAGILNGVSTYDIILITKHLLGEQMINSPYKLIAADANKSGNISTLDIILIRKLLLGLESKIANNTSWRFVPANYTFPVASNPWSAAFPEVLNINNLAGSVNGDFVAIKVGDVNNSAVIDVQPRSNASFAMNVEDIAIKAGNEYTVNFTSNASDVEGFQMALSYRGLELVDIVEGIAKVENFGTKFTGEGVILTSWNGAAANGNMFGLVFRATQDSKLSEALSVSTRYINAEAYNNAGEAMNVALNFNSGAVAEAAFELKQNMPNPFKGETMIGFNLPESGKATLTINDVTGRVLKVVRGDFAKGANQISIHSKDLPASGVLYYTLTAREYNATKKMIILE